VYLLWLLACLIACLLAGWLACLLTHRDTETQRHRDTETQRHRDTETQRHRDTETQRHSPSPPQRCSIDWISLMFSASFHYNNKHPEAVDDTDHDHIHRGQYKSENVLKRNQKAAPDCESHMRRMQNFILHTHKYYWSSGAAV
jgi:hypothetical protein